MTNAEKKDLDIQKIRRRVEDRLRKSPAQMILEVAKLLGVKIETPREKLMVEYEITPGCWVEVEVSDLTDDFGSTPTAELLKTGQEWYLNGDFTVPPREIRLTTSSK